MLLAERSGSPLYVLHMAAGAGVNEPALSAPARPGDLLRSALDPGRAAIQLGWKPWTSLSEGTRGVLDWFRRQQPPAPE